MSDSAIQPRLLESTAPKATGPVECLGLTFPDDDARRAHFTELLRAKLQDPAFRQIEGFPIGSDEDILALSDPPYYTACPNPFLTEFIHHYGKPYDPATDTYRREPFAVDVSEGKTDALYKAHGYHTKVPHLAIVPSILHYTEPGDVVLDGFCGSGMTGVAAQWCGSAPDSYRQDLEMVWEKEGRSKPQWGVRRVVLNDLSPAATFIAANYNLPFDVNAFATAGRQLLDEVERELGWMYETLHADGKTKGRIEYTVWSEVFSCPECAGEVVFFDEALDKESKRVRDAFACPHCESELTKTKLERIYKSHFDSALQSAIRTIKRKPVLISYKVSSERFEKKPDLLDLTILEKIGQLPIPPTFPTDKMMHTSDNTEKWGDKWRAGTASFSHVHHLFLPRAVHSLMALWQKATAYHDKRVRQILIFFIEQAISGMSVLNRYQPIQYGRTGGSQVNRQLSGVYYVASQHAEVSPEYNLGNKLDRLVKAFHHEVACKIASIVAAGSAACLGIPNNSVDYIFTDPPFGDNLVYSELNFLVESFHRVFSNNAPEAIVSLYQKKGLVEYQHLMQCCFAEYYRVLKPGRWMTVVFHNSRNAVWNTIQEAMLAAGFVVADVRVLDKQQGSFNQAVAVGSVKQDLVISAYKPSSGLEERFKLEAGTIEGAWDFIRAHLKQVPIVVVKGNGVEVVAERQNYLLFDRMIAFHIQHGVSVPLSATEFYQGLDERFPERDSMYFLPEQAAEYDKKRLTIKEVLQLSLMVTDESSAIQWLKQQLTKRPQTFQELHPVFMRELSGWQKHEKALELFDLLEQNFLRYDGKGEVPSPIHSYLSTNYKELRNLAKDDPNLRAKAKDRWYLPDPNKATDMEKLREKALLREFDDYRTAKQKRLKVFRLEAMRAGFKKAWQERDYATIIAVAEKIPENVLQEDAKLLMWYDQALTRTGQ